MSWLEVSEVLGNLGEFLGSTGVLATLIYLAAPVSMLCAQNMNDHMAMGNKILIARAKRMNDNPVIAELVLETNAKLGAEMDFGAFGSRLRDLGLENR